MLTDLFALLATPFLVAHCVHFSLGMHTRAHDKYHIPKDRSHLAWFALGLTIIVAAAALIIGGFIVADRRAPSPTELDETGSTVP
jgi:hypothetical protein